MDMVRRSPLPVLACARSCCTCAVADRREMMVGDAPMGRRPAVIVAGRVLPRSRPSNSAAPVLLALASRPPQALCGRFAAGVAILADGVPAVLARRIDGRGSGEACAVASAAAIDAGPFANSLSPGLRQRV